MTKVLEDVGCFWNLWRGYSNVVQDWRRETTDGRNMAFPRYLTWTYLCYMRMMVRLHCDSGKWLWTSASWKGHTAKTCENWTKSWTISDSHKTGAHFVWWVVSTPLKNINQLGWLFPAYGKIKNVPNHQPACSIIAWAQDYVSICLRKREDPELLASHLLLWGYGVKELYNISLNPPKKLTIIINKYMQIMAGSTNKHGGDQQTQTWVWPTKTGIVIRNGYTTPENRGWV